MWNNPRDLGPGVLPGLWGVEINVVQIFDKRIHDENQSIFLLPLHFRLTLFPLSFLLFVFFVLFLLVAEISSSPLCTSPGSGSMYHLEGHRYRVIDGPLLCKVKRSDDFACCKLA